MFWATVSQLLISLGVLILMFHCLCYIVGARNFVPNLLKKIGKQLLNWLGKLLTWLLRMIGRVIAFPFRLLFANVRVAAPILWRRFLAWARR